MPRRTLASQLLVLALLGAALLAVSVAAIGIGDVAIGWREAIAILLDGPPADAPGGAAPVSPHVAIIWRLRLPRILLAILVGGALAAAGMTMQALFQNPLADPYLVGVAPGAAVGATAALVLGLGAGRLGAHALPLAAFAGSLVVSLLVYILASRFGRVPVLHLLLFGIAIGAFCTGLTSFLLLISPQHVQEVYFWLLGSFQNARWAAVRTVWPYLLAGTLLLFFFAREMDVLLLGEEQAQSLGVAVERLKRILLAASTLLAAVAVAVGGIIGFVGLIVPHMMRLLVGPRHRVLLPASVLGGAALLVVSDTLARSLRPATEIPVGIVTTFLGVPFFLYLLTRKRIGAGG